MGYSAGYIPECYDNLEAVLTDNASHVQEMMGLFGFTKDKFLVHYQPAPETGKSVILREDSKDKLDILWAGRMDRQKRPDLLLEIAKRSKQLPFTFHVYGSPVLNADLYSVAIAEAENIHFHGPFDGLTSLELKDIDAYLYTSQWDGLPNILLEAIAIGLPVVASDVGGISELIIDGETGLLVRPFDDIDQYIKAFTKLYESSSLCVEFISNSQQLLLSRHTWDKFHDNIETIPHYI